METQNKVAWGRFGAIAAMAMVAVLGNMRPTTSQAALQAQSRVPVRLEQSAQDDSRLNEPYLMDVDGDGESRDDGELVPAIYAWDPDVRFVYYRHMSKWM